MANYQVQPAGPFNFQAAEVLAANTLVKLNDAGKLVAAVLGDRPLGIVYQPAAAINDWVAVESLCGIVQGVAVGAVNVGELVRCGAAGAFAPEAVVTTATAFTLGVANETVIDGAVIHVVCF